MMRGLTIIKSTKVDNNNLKKREKYHEKGRFFIKNKIYVKTLEGLC